MTHENKTAASDNSARIQGKRNETSWGISNLLDNLLRVFLFLSLILIFPLFQRFKLWLWIIVGLAVGIIPQAIVTKNQLNRLSKDYQFTTNGKDMVLLIVPVVLFFIFGIFFGWFSYYSVWVLCGFLFILLGVSYQLTRGVLFAAFERKENMRLMQSWLGTGNFYYAKSTKQQR